ncbi:MAG: cysteine desulfurase [Acidobacteriota bacterium]
MSSNSTARTGEPRFDVKRLRSEFPIFDRPSDGRPLIYLDSAASTQKPQSVIDAVSRFYTTKYANIHRGIHRLSQEATLAYEHVREQSRNFINARSTREIVFVRGTTEAINLVAATFGRQRIQRGDEVLITHMEHHANIVPWQLLCGATGAVLRVARIDDRGELDLDDFTRQIGSKTKLAAIVHTSNALGTINPIGEIVQICHQRGVPVLVDGAQAMAHGRVDVQALDADFFCFSSHKMYGPSGVGVLYAKQEWLETMPPYQGGGEMILSVSFERTTYNQIPHRFEAGTPNIEGAVGMGAAIEFLESLDREALAEHEGALYRYAMQSLEQIPQFRPIGTARHKSAVVSFALDGVHPHDVGTILDGLGIAVRAGHHCAQPLMARFGVPATTRASFGAYNTKADVDALVGGVKQVLEIFR